MSPPFAGQTAVVTGATSGIGAAIARALALGGATVHALGRSAPGNEGEQRSAPGNEGEQRSAPDEGERRSAPGNESGRPAPGKDGGRRAAEDGPKPGGDLLWHRVDLGDDAAIADFTAGLPRDARALDILVHGAGLHAIGSVATAPVADLDALWRINLRAPYLVTQGLLPLLRSGQGQVVFVNSSVWANARAELAAYAASKYALKALADSLRAEVGADGLRVLSVFPGRTATPMQAEIFAAEGAAYRPEALLQPEDIAATLVAALALPRTAEITDLYIRPGRKPETRTLPPTPAADTH